jgi:hypothetical protein
VEEEGKPQKNQMMAWVKGVGQTFKFFFLGSFGAKDRQSLDELFEVNSTAEITMVKFCKKKNALD